MEVLQNSEHMNQELVDRIMVVNKERDSNWKKAPVSFDDMPQIPESFF